MGHVAMAVGGKVVLSAFDGLTDMQTLILLEYAQRAFS